MNELQLFNSSLPEEKMMTVKELAEEIKVSPSSIHTEAKNLSISFKKEKVNHQMICFITEEQANILKQSFNERKIEDECKKKEIEDKKLVTTKELADVLGVAIDTVRRAVKTLFSPYAVLHMRIKGSDTVFFTEEQATAIKQKLQKHHNLAKPETINSVTTEQEENEKIMEAMQILAMRKVRLEKEVEELKAQAEINAPKVEVYDLICESSDLVSVDQVAKTLGYGRNNFFRLLREENIFYKKDGENTVYQKYLDAGYFKTKTEQYIKNGEIELYQRIFFTGKGVTWITERLASEVVRL